MITRTLVFRFPSEFELPGSTLLLLYFSPGLWNGLPNDIRNTKTMDVFKSLVKTHLFRNAYACYFFIFFFRILYF